MPVQAQTAKPDERITAEIQYRPGVNPDWYPLLEVYLSNRGKEPLVWEKAELNGAPAGFLTNGMIWHQFYPSTNSAAGQTVALQISIPDKPVTPLKVAATTADGRRVEVSFTNTAKPKAELMGIVFSSDYRRLFLSYSAAGAQALAALTINGAVPAQWRTLALPNSTNHPGWARADLAEPLKLGQAVHVRLAIEKGPVIQAVVRAFSGFCLDSYGISETNTALRQDLHLDAEFRQKFLPIDAACNDLNAEALGYSMAQILAMRRTAYEKGTPALVTVHLCTAANASRDYPVYGQSVDMLEMNPYFLERGGTDRFIELEDQWMRWLGWATRPKPWGWIPYAFTRTDRMLEPEELRAMAFAAIGQGARSIHYFVYGKDISELKGFDASPRLLEEVKRLNADIRKLEPLLAETIPVSAKTAGQGKDQVRVYTLWSGDRGLVVIVRNLDYTTDTQGDALGEKPRFKLKSKRDVELEVLLPPWLDVPEEFEWERPLGGGPAAGWRDGNTLGLQLENLELCDVFWLSERKEKRE